MKNSFALEALDPEMEVIAAYDHAEIDNPDPLAFSRLSYLDRINLIVTTVRLLIRTGGAVAELGCAQGNVSLLLAEAGCRVTAVDLNPIFLNYSQAKYERGDITWRLANIEEHGLSLESQEFVILGEVVEHCAYPERIVDKCFKLLVPGGYLLITTPNRSFLGSQRLPSFRQILKRSSRSDLEARQFGPDGKDHLFLFTRRELRLLCPFGGTIAASGYLSNSLLHKLPKVLVALLFNPTSASKTMRLLSLLPMVNRLSSSGQFLLIRKETTHHEQGH
jgi:SAM-dependent methyltransferase